MNSNTLSKSPQDLNNHDLLARARELAHEERRTGVALLHHLREIERRRLFALSHSSLHEDVVRELGYSDGAAHRRISAMRLMKAVPEIEEKLKTGVVSLSSASQVQNFIRAERRVTGNEVPQEVVRSLVAQVEGKSTRETEALLAATSPRAAAALRERTRSIDGENVQITVILRPELQRKLKQLRDRMAHKNANPSIAEQIELLADFTLKKLGDGALSISSGSSCAEASPRIMAERPKGDTLGPSNARSIAPSVRRQVWRRAGGRCEHRYNNRSEHRHGSEAERCTRTHLLQVDHRIPVAWGGGREFENLQLLCAVHNQLKSDRLPSRH
jgi:hypothetical protein